LKTKSPNLAELHSNEQANRAPLTLAIIAARNGPISRRACDAQLSSVAIASSYPVELSLLREKKRTKENKRKEKESNGA
jgi:hypothetical protein